MPPNAQIVQTQRPQQTDTVYINYFDGIDMPRAQALMGLCTQVLGRFRPKVLYFMFATPGGEVSAGIALHNFLKALPVKIVMHNMGAVNSIGNVVFLAAPERYGSPTCTFLFHGVEIRTQKDASFNVSKLNEIMSGLNEDENKIAKIIAEHSKMDESEIREMFAKGKHVSAAFAVEKGLVSEIKDANLKPEDIIISVGGPVQRN